MSEDQMALMIPIMALMIPVSAIVFGIIAGIVKSILNSQERRLQMKLQLKQQQVGMSDQQLQDLRDEIARLRDTSTQFCMSLDHKMHRMEQRLEHVERQLSGSAMSDPVAPDPRPAPMYQQPIEPPVQQIARRS